MGVKKYESRGRVYFRIDSWLMKPDGTPFRFRQSKIPTREQAVALLAKVRTECFEGRYFDRRKVVHFTVEEILEAYLPISRRDNRSWRMDESKARNIIRHIGKRSAASLTQRDVDDYRNLRFAEGGRRGDRPAPATLDRETALLKRALNYAVKCGQLDRHPLYGVEMLNVPNVRRVVIDEATFAKLVEAADPEFRPILLVAYDTGMRKDEIRTLRWEQVDLKEGYISLSHEDTKTATSRRVYLTSRVIEAIKQVPRHLESPYVFTSSRTGTMWKELRRFFTRACERAGVSTETWFHDLRRSFVTNARRRGVPESVVMRMSGHKTRSVFDRYNVVDDTDVKLAVAQIEAARRKEEELAHRDAEHQTRFGQGLLRVQ
jgi:integrase